MGDSEPNLNSECMYYHNSGSDQTPHRTLRISNSEKYSYTGVGPDALLSLEYEGPRNLLSGRGKAQLFLHSIPLPATKALHTYYAAAVVKQLQVPGNVYE